MAHMNIDALPIGTAIEIMHIDDTGSYIAHLIKGFDKPEQSKSMQSE